MEHFPAVKFAMDYEKTWAINKYTHIVYKHA